MPKILYNLFIKRASRNKGPKRKRKYRSVPRAEGKSLKELTSQERMAIVKEENFNLQKLNKSLDNYRAVLN